VQETFEQLHSHDLSYAIVTDPEGRLLGTVHRSDLDPASGADRSS